MNAELLLALLSFACIAAFTPGPNNTILMASGLNFGWRRSLPTILGVCVGFPVMIALIGLGLGQVFTLYPQLYLVLKYVGAAYMLYLAWKIASAQPASEISTEEIKPLSFLQMSLFQWINPKGWIMAVTALSTYTLPNHYLLGASIIVGVFIIMGLASAVTWVAFGASLKRFLTHPRYFRPINIGLGLLLVLSLVPMLRHG